MTCELLDAYGMFDGTLELRDAPTADINEVCITHSRDYLETLQALETNSCKNALMHYGLGTSDNPVFPNILKTSLVYTGASAQAAQDVIDGSRLAFNIAGGLHHAHRSRAAGFCVLNDCAVAIHRLKTHYAKVAYIDIDAHHGDGVQELFYSDPNVLTISLHESGRSLFPGTGFIAEEGEGEGIGASINLPFATGTNDPVWLYAWTEAALPILKAFNPDAIVLQMGTDAHALDPLAHLNLSAEGWLQAIRDVAALNRPIVALGGGGYNLTTVPRMWALAVSVLSGIELNNDVPVYCRIHDEIPYLKDVAGSLPPVKEDDKVVNYGKMMTREVQNRFFHKYGISFEPEISRY